MVGRFAEAEMVRFGLGKTRLAGQAFYMENVPRPTLLSGRGNQGTASPSKTLQFSLKQRLDARASIQVIEPAPLGSAGL